MTMYPPTDPTFFVGVDLGQTSDPAAIVVAEEHLWVPTPEQRRATGVERPPALTTGWEPFTLAGGEEDATGWQLPSLLSPARRLAAREWTQRHGYPDLPPVTIRTMHRPRLGTPYPVIVSTLVRLLHTPPLSPDTTALCLDATGVGAPVVDMCRQAGLAPVAISITAGNSVSGHVAEGVGVPKLHLIRAAQVGLQTGQLRIAADQPDAGVLLEEFRSYQVRITPAGNEQFGEWRTGKHDDLVIAAAMCIWFRNWYCGARDTEAVRHWQRLGSDPDAETPTPHPLTQRTQRSRA